MGAKTTQSVMYKQGALQSYTHIIKPKNSSIPTYAGVNKRRLTQKTVHPGFDQASKARLPHGEHYKMH